MHDLLEHGSYRNFPDIAASPLAREEETRLLIESLTQDVQRALNRPSEVPNPNQFDAMADLG